MTQHSPLFTARPAQKPTPGVNAPAVAPPAHRNSTAAPSASPSAVPSHKDVAERAFDLYIRGGCQQDQSDQNWQQAEKELRANGPAACHADHSIKETFAPDAHSAR